MSTVFRYDAGTLQKPRRTPQGFLRVDGLASRVGILEYRDGLGGVRRELRLPDDVFSPSSLEAFEGAPVTNDHPSDMVHPGNARSVTLGTVLGSGRRDGDHVAVSLIVTDKDLIKQMEDGKRQLSVGYSVVLDETPGTHPEFGRYDAIQRQIMPNHLAVVDRGRAGPSAAVRMDASAWVSSTCTGEGDPTAAYVMLSSNDIALDELRARVEAVLDGLPNINLLDGPPDRLDSLAVSCWSNGASVRVQSTDLSGSELRAKVIAALATDSQLAVRTDGVAPVLHVAKSMPDSSHTDDVAQEPTVNLEQALAALAASQKEAGAAAARADQAEQAAKLAVARADQAESEKRVAAEAQAKAEGERDQARKDAESAVARADQAAKDAADQVTKARKDAEDLIPARVNARVTVMTLANSVLGATDKDGKLIDRSDMSDRAIKVAVVKHVDGDDLGDDRHDAYVDAMFDGACRRHAKGSNAATAARAAIEGNRSDVAATLATDPSTDEQKANASYRNEISQAWMTPAKKGE